MMKLLPFLSLFYIQTFAQNNSEINPIESKSIIQYSKQQLLGEWVKKEIRLKDGSKIYNNASLDTDLRYKFDNNDSVRITYDSKTSQAKYLMRGSALFINYIKFEIVSLTETELILVDSADENGVKIIMQPLAVHLLGFLPKSYFSKGNDTIYIARRGFLEPFFMSDQQSPMDFIFEKFDFPEFKTGNFVARFVITKEAKVRAINIINSTHEKYNIDLIKAIRASEGKWVPATWEGKPVNTEMEMGFDLGWSEKMNRKNKDSDDKKQNLSLSSDYLLQGNGQYELKNYKSALKFYTLSIENNYQNIDAYYMRAATFIILKQSNKACEDLLQLTHLEQKHAENLYRRYCKEFKKE